MSPSYLIYHKYFVALCVKSLTFAVNFHIHRMSVKTEIKDWPCQTSFLTWRCIKISKQIDIRQFPDHSQLGVIQVKMDEAATKTLVFFVNGKKVIDANPDPGETLLTYLRNKLRSPSTSDISKYLVLKQFQYLDHCHCLLDRIIRSQILYSHFIW